MKFRPAVARCFVAAALLVGSAAEAGTLSPGTLIAGPAGTTSVAEPRLAGKVVEDETTPFDYTGWFLDSFSGSAQPVYGRVSGTVQARVVLAADGSYDFYWRISVDRDAFLPVLDFGVSGLAPATYETDWRSDLQGEVPPATVSEQTSGDVGWEFGQYIPPSSEIYPGQRSYFVFLDSDARHYARSAFFSLKSGRDSGGSMNIDWGGASGLYPTFGPATAAELTRGHRAPAAIATAYIKSDAFLATLSGRQRGCIVSNIARQQGRYAAYGPKGGPYDARAVRAAAQSYASLCR
jgi:hypothetical protein